MALAYNHFMENSLLQVITEFQAPETQTLIIFGN